MSETEIRHVHFDRIFIHSLRDLQKKASYRQAALNIALVVN